MGRLSLAVDSGGRISLAGDSKRQALLGRGLQGCRLCLAGVLGGQAEAGRGLYPGACGQYTMDTPSPSPWQQWSGHYIHKTLTHHLFPHPLHWGVWAAAHEPQAHKATPRLHTPWTVCNIH